MDPFVFAIVKRSSEKQFRKDHQDLAKYGSSLPMPGLSDFVVVTDCEWLISSLLPKEVMSTLTTYKSQLLSIHFTDQNDLYASKYKKILRFQFKLPSDPQILTTCVRMCFFLIDHVAKTRIPKSVSSIVLSNFS